MLPFFLPCGGSPETPVGRRPLSPVIPGVRHGRASPGEDGLQSLVLNAEKVYSQRMEYIDNSKDIAAQVRFYEHIATFMIAEADAEDDDEDCIGLTAVGCGDCVSIDILEGESSKSIIITKDDARKLGEFLIATANL